MHHPGLDASFSGSSCQPNINSASLVDKTDSISIDDLCCTDVSTPSLHKDSDICVETSSLEGTNNDSLACIKSTPSIIVMPIVDNIASSYNISFDSGMQSFVNFDSRCFHFRIVGPCTDSYFISYIFKDHQHHLFQGGLIVANAHEVRDIACVPNHLACEPRLCLEYPTHRHNIDMQLRLGIPIRDDHVLSTPHITFSFHHPFLYYVDNDYLLNTLKF